MLHIVGRRADGYHELQTVFQLIDLCDRIEIAVREDGVITRPKGPAGVAEDDGPGRPGGPGAAAGHRHRAGRRHFGSQAHSAWAAGLGGGSSDAATTLVALNQMWRTGLTSRADRGILASSWAPMCPFSWPDARPGPRESAKNSRRSRLGADSWYLVIFPGLQCQPPRYSRLLN